MLCEERSAMLSFLRNSAVTSSILLGIVLAGTDKAIAKDIVTVKSTLTDSTQTITQQVQNSKPKAQASLAYSVS